MCEKLRDTKRTIQNISRSSQLYFFISTWYVFSSLNLLFQLREAQSRVEELETTNMHLQKRLDKVSKAKSALLKDIQ